MAAQLGQHSGREMPGTLYGLVVLGASAGGIEALTTVLSALTADFAAPLVIAQHLDPRRPSHLADILARHSTLPVHLVSEVASLVPGTVYVVPADRDIEIDDHEVRVRASLGTPSIPSANRLFSSAARAYGERLIAVILTGTGSDGADGAREVKAVGGTVVIEDPATAAFPGMPGSLAPTTVDIVAHLDQIGPLLHDLLAGAYVPTPLDPDFPVATEGDVLSAEDDLLGPLLAQLRQQSGIDFAGYRRPTILRRLQRRMLVTKSSLLDDYRRYLAHHPEEYQLLVSSFLIKVTEFFRDAELFAALRDRVLPELITYARTQGNQLRLWSAGCATGEEAYSLAILVAETLGAELSQFTIRLFATDLDARAVAFARRGIYPAAALAGIPEELRNRYFTQVDGMYEVKKAIRSLVTFGEHDLGQRPPFPHTDLVLCRNVLIYFTPEVQLRALSLFAFALRLGGYLALGKAESASLLADYLTPVDTHLKLFRRVGANLPPPVLPLVGDSFAQSRRILARTRRNAPVAIGLEPEEPPGTGVWLADAQVSSLAAGVPFGMVIVDRRYHILTINSAALRLLDIYQPAVGNDLVHLAEHVPGTELRGIIDAIFRADRSTDGADVDADLGQPAEVTRVVTLVTGLGERRDVQIAAYPYLPHPSSARGSRGTHATTERVEAALLLVTDVTQAVQARIAAEVAAVRNQSAPQQALQRQGMDIERLTAQMEQMTAVNRQLQSANQELGGDNLELQRVNDELLLAQEMEQASTEEIRTLNEELQAGNEELETVNEELQATVEELQLSNDTLLVRSEEVRELADAAAQQHRKSEAERAQLAAILASLGDAVLVVDPSGVPLLTNEAYVRMFGDASARFAPQDTEGHDLPLKATPQRRAARGETFVMEFTLEQDDAHAATSRRADSRSIAWARRWVASSPCATSPSVASTVSRTSSWPWPAMNCAPR